jgi:stringent starvation protein B
MNINGLYETPFNHHLLIAYINWLNENDERCEVLIDADLVGDDMSFLKEFFSKHSTLVINLSKSATRNLLITAEMVSFAGKIRGKSYQIEIPTAAVMGILVRTGEEKVLLPFVPMIASMNIVIEPNKLKTRTINNPDSKRELEEDVAVIQSATILEFKRPAK